jgi:hypothetical protein
MTTMTAAPISAPISVATLELLDRARSGLLAAAMAERAGERYVTAHLSALRAAAAMLATRGRPSGRGTGPRSVWAVLPRVAPELTEWAAFFAAGADRRAALEAGRVEVIPVREADDQLRAAETFIQLVETALGLDGMTVSRLPLPGLRPVLS